MITAQITGDTRAVELFDASELPQRYYDQFLSVISDLTDEMYDIALGLAPSRTGALRQSIHKGIRKGAGFIKGIVESEAGAKAVALEYGADGRSKTNVRAHKMHLDHLWAQAISPIIVSVPAFDRVQNIAPHPFMRPAFDSVKGRLEPAIQGGMDAVESFANGELQA